MKILFITATRIGDAVLSTGVLDHLIGQNPNARITVVCGPAARGLFDAVPGLERMIVLNKKPYSLHWIDMWRACIGSFWDVVVDLRNAPISYLLASRKSYHLGRSNMTGHRVIRNGALLGMADAPPTPKLWCTPEHISKAQELIPAGQSVIAIAPIANWKPKTWSAANYVELVKRLSGTDGILPGAKVIIFGTSEEREQARDVLQGIPPDQLMDCMGTLSLLEIYACLKRCAFFVGNDSGLMHMAAAADIPTLGLFGPSRENHYAPWGEKSMPIRGELSYDEIFPKDYDFQKSEIYELMAGLSVDVVEEAANTLWQRVTS